MTLSVKMMDNEEVQRNLWAWMLEQDVFKKSSVFDELQLLL